MSYPRRGDVYLVRFDPAQGAEIKKTRPALIIQNNIGNKHSQTIIAAAVTSKFDGSLYPTEVLIKKPEGGLSTDSVVRLDHIRTLDKGRLIKRLGRLRPTTMQKVDEALKISLNLIDI